jgi:uncharacterized SAM-binding protein YcdF (DUF218 family)
MDFIKRAVEIFFSPMGAMTLLLLGGAILALWKRHSQWGRRFLLTGTGLFLVFTFSPLAEILIRDLECDYPPLLAPPASIPIRKIVVLSGYGEEHPGIPITSAISEHTLCRLSEGIRLYRLLAGSKLLLSGGTLRTEDKPVAGIMANYLRQQGIPDQDILTEERSLTTYENLVEVKKMLGAEPFILVTSACDLRRAMAVTRKLGLNAIAAPACIWTLQNWPPAMSWSEWGLTFLEAFGDPSPTRWSYLQWAYHEYVGYVWYKLLGRV